MRYYTVVYWKNLYIKNSLVNTGLYLSALKMIRETDVDFNTIIILVVIRSGFKSKKQIQKNEKTRLMKMGKLNTGLKTGKTIRLKKISMKIICYINV
ncbi:Hypothetical protein PAU_02308 [Photorhabdus asymbiotica]|uniref:Uncharacterized protein n=2 Tax=Photorhabdus asymbiotica TaxID=291112 RepID=B6VKU4_PHOAA|nr:Hypothetical protein PAU_02308 [Photorhabdus asymbiotica]CAR66774.1 Hypothetical protein PA-RVA5-3172 [Photorhabdus asymbiotica subsp. asymbiotica ATCC 43949]